MEVGKPINVMLFPKAKDVNDAFDIVGKPAAFEYKYDGFRTQIHKTGDIVTLFSRRFENVTLQFPEIVKAVKKNVKAEECILDAEAVGIDPKTGKNLPFQKISQRIKRKYDIEKIAKQFPVELNIFDILSYKGESLLQTKFKKRREILNAIVEEEEKSIVLAKQLITNDEKKAQEFYAKALKNGEEGVMVKSLEGIYKPGARVGYGVKLKSIMEPLDLVIVAGEYGEGKMSEPNKISNEINNYFLNLKNSKKLKALVTAGPTNEYIDPVRFITNKSSGKQGYEIAKSLSKKGFDTTLISGPTNLKVDESIKLIKVETANEMLVATQDNLPTDVAIFSAAVADFKINKKYENKIKKQDSLSLNLEKNVDILNYISNHNSMRPDLVIGFAAETTDVENNAEEKLNNKNCDCE